MSEAGAGSQCAHGVCLRVAYDGTGFAGWQAQVGQRTVQATVAEAAQRIAGHSVSVRGCSRTDAGVHAVDQVAAFSTERELPPERWVRALNRYLPADVAVRTASVCAPDYEPRFDALEKTYRYRIHLGAVRDPLLRDRAWHLGRHVRWSRASAEASPRPELDLAAMRSAATTLVGTHDFRAFRSADDTRDNTVRTLHRVRLLETEGENPDLLAIEVTGTAFMKNMVRILAGTLVDVGKGAIPPARVASLLGPDARRDQAGITAPPQGLVLTRVRLGRLRARASHTDP